MILIIDDDSAVRSSLSFMLKRAGYEAQTVPGPREAMEVGSRVIISVHSLRSHQPKSIFPPNRQLGAISDAIPPIKAYRCRSLRPGVNSRMSTG